jgi:hypothetical protein
MKKLVSGKNYAQYFADFKSELPSLKGDVFTSFMALEARIHNIAARDLVAKLEEMNAAKTDQHVTTGREKKEYTIKNYCEWEMNQQHTVEYLKDFDKKMAQYPRAQKKREKILEEEGKNNTTPVVAVVTVDDNNTHVQRVAIDWKRQAVARIVADWKTQAEEAALKIKKDREPAAQQLPVIDEQPPPATPPSLQWLPPQQQQQQQRPVFNVVPLVLLQNTRAEHSLDSLRMRNRAQEKKTRDALYARKKSGWLNHRRDIQQPCKQY